MRTLTRLLAAALLVLASLTALPTLSHAQSRGVYPLGMTSVGAGVTPTPGFTYANQLLFYSRDTSKADDGSTQPVSGEQWVVMDMNSFVWVSRKTMLGGAHYSAVATLPIAKNQLVSDIHGPLNGGGGFADSYYLPLILGWNRPRASFRALAGFLAPTGRFTPGASDNVGSGYWTPTLSSGQSFQLTADNRWTLSTFQLYEFRTTQEGTGITVGDSFDLDYSLLRTFRFANGSSSLQLGVAGYEQRQTTAKTGPSVTLEQAAERHAINALGIASTFATSQRWNLSVRAFKEFANRAAYQGYSFQVSGSVKLWPAN